MTTMAHLKRIVLAMLFLMFGSTAMATDQPEYALGAGDVIKITVFQNPDLSIETKVLENGAISYPLLGSIQVGGLTIPAAEKLIAMGLQKGNFVVQPQVNILLSQANGSQAAVLGQVNKPGRFPIDTGNIRISDMLALAGGITPTGSDSVILTGTRDGKPIRKEIDVTALLDRPDQNMRVQGGDVIYVSRAPVYYIYGEVQRPGSYRLEREMAVIQALAQAGGLTPRGTSNGLKIVRHSNSGAAEELRPSMTDRVQADDVLYVRESLF